MAVVSQMPRAIKSTFWHAGGRDLSALSAADFCKGMERSLSAVGHSRTRARAMVKALGGPDRVPETEISETDFAALIAALRS